MDTQMLDDNVCQLIESLWTESIGDLNELLTIEPETIALQTVGIHSVDENWVLNDFVCR